MKILVAYYSRSGLTKWLAQRIAVACDADLEAIEDLAGPDMRGGGVGYARSALQAFLHIQAPIRPLRFAPERYDLTLIGTPVWSWNMSSPVRSYVQGHSGEFRHVAYFCTCAGSGQAKVLADLERLGGTKSVARLALTEEEISGRRVEAKLAEFVAGVNKVLPPTRREGRAVHAKPVVSGRR